MNKLIVLFSWVALSVCLDAQITLGTTVGTFGVLAGSTVTSTSTAGTLVIGNLGVWPGTAITGITGIAPGGPGIVTGTIHSDDAFAGTAQSELTAAYNTVAGTASTATWNTDLGGHTFYVGGVYTAPSTTLTTATSSAVNLVNCQASNIFWLVGSSATIGTYSSFYGNILAHDAITLTTGASLHGRALARGAAVTLDDNAITMPATLGGGTGGGPPVSGGSGLPSTPAPSSLILVALALVCVGVYQARKRLPKLLGRN